MAIAVTKNAATKSSIPPSKSGIPLRGSEPSSSLKEYTAVEWLSLVSGFVMLAAVLPFVGTVVGTAVLWDALDRGFRGNPLDGLLCSFARWVNVKTAAFNRRFVKHEEDAYVLNAALLHGVAIPALFWLCAWYEFSANQGSLSLPLVFAYHLLRIGPYFMNFAYVYTLCHKEGHMKGRTSMWADEYNNSYTRGLYNWWVGLYYGVFPASFAIGHSINHHKHNNGPKDVISSADKPRDSFINFVAYLPRQALYACNITTIAQFYEERKPGVARRMIWGSLYFVVWVGAFAWFDLRFAVAYLVFPFFENVILLACIGWTWHSFLNPDDPSDEFVGSVTIYDGHINVLNEDYHVVHHQYPGMHWTKNVELHEKHKARGEYSKTVATCFQDTHVFELFFLIILAEYTKMAEKFYDHSGKLSLHDKKKLIKERLRTIWWGHRLANKAEKRQ